MNKVYTLLLVLLGLTLSTLQLQADEWTYDFENFAKISGGKGGKSAIDVTIDGLSWHMYGVTNCGGHWSDWKRGEQSLKLFGENNSGATEMTQVTLMTPRDIGRFKFWARANERWMGEGTQVAWIVQWSDNGSNWVTAGDPFKPGSEPEEIVREINRENVQVRIVREDYLTYDFANPSSPFAYLWHLDDMTITDVTGDINEVSLSSSVGSELDFGEMNLGETVSKGFTLTYSGLADAKPTLTLQGDNADAFTISRQETIATGQDSVIIACKAMRRGAHSAFVEASYGDLKTTIQLKALGKKEDSDKKFSGGDGTEQNPYLITSPEDLMELSEEVEMNKNPYEGAYFKMTNDISMDGVKSFRPIGNDWGRETSDPTRIRPFSGIFDGGGFAVKNLEVNWPKHMFGGLFGIVKNATIKNLTLSKSSIFGGAGLGAIVGVSLGSFSLENCHTTADVTVWTNTMYVGGIIGGALFPDASKTSRITSCTNAATVNGELGGTGGIIGCASQANLLIERCGNYGQITDQNSSLGGIVGVASDVTHITDCFNAGIIDCVNQQSAQGTAAGGILGEWQISNKVTGDLVISISNCYNIGRAKKLDETFHPIYNPLNADNIDRVKLSNNYYSREVNDMAYDQDLDSEHASYAVQEVSLAEMKTDPFLVRLNPTHNVWCFLPEVNNGFPVPQGDGSPRGIELPQVALDVQLYIVDGRLVVEGDYTAIYLYDLQGMQIDPTQPIARGAYLARLVVGDVEATYKLLY